MITLYTHQRPSVWARLQKGYVARAYQRHVRLFGSIPSFFGKLDPEWQMAYRWLEDQFRKRVGPLPGNRALYWAYADHDKPDYRCYEWKWMRGHPDVLLTLEVDPARCLVFGMDDWHMILGDAPAVVDDPYEGAFWTDEQWDTFFDMPIEQKRASWEHIFSPERLRLEPCHQAVLAEIRPEDVVGYRYPPRGRRR